MARVGCGLMAFLQTGGSVEWFRGVSHRRTRRTALLRSVDIDRRAREFRIERRGAAPRKASEAPRLHRLEVSSEVGTTRSLMDLVGILRS